MDSCRIHRSGRDNIPYTTFNFTHVANRLIVPNVGCALHSLRNPVRVDFTLLMGGER